MKMTKAELERELARWQEIAEHVERELRQSEKMLRGRDRDAEEWKKERATLERRIAELEGQRDGVLSAHAQLFDRVRY
jgi:uncharacterized protein YhaN